MHIKKYIACVVNCCFYFFSASVWAGEVIIGAWLAHSYSFVCVTNRGISITRPWISGYWMIGQCMENLFPPPSVL